MDFIHALGAATVLAPVALMAVAAALCRLDRLSISGLWKVFQALSGAALFLIATSIYIGPSRVPDLVMLRASAIGLTMALLVQLLGAVIGGFSSRYLQGEEGQRRYVAALALVLAVVHLLLLADHWIVLVAAWALVGVALQRLLCFYEERVFARLAAHKKRLADRVADGLLVSAASLAWSDVGSGRLSALWTYVEQEGMSVALTLCAVALVLSAILRTALLPVHGWLIQVMEAPTPVSALLHAGVVNLGGFVLIRFAPLLQQATAARVLLLTFGLATSVLAGMVMLTRISIKVRLAWSTVAQMGFMLLECALGLYTLAALHLIGHSLYKAHAFLSASSVVRSVRLQALHTPVSPSGISLILSPVLTISLVLWLVSMFGSAAWPWWWSGVLGLAWAPLLWLPAAPISVAARCVQALAGLLMVAFLTAAALLAHRLPLGIEDAPLHELGPIALVGLTALYLCLALLQHRPGLLSRWRRWSYAGFYVDEAYTRLVLQLWPSRWTPETVQGETTSLLTHVPR